MHIKVTVKLLLQYNIAEYGVFRIRRVVIILKVIAYFSILLLLKQNQTLYELIY